VTDPGLTPNLFWVLVMASGSELPSVPKALAMPGVAARLGDDVDYRTCVAAVFRTELIGDKHILLATKSVVGKEKARAADAIVIVVLAVNLPGSLLRPRSP